MPHQQFLGPQFSPQSPFGPFGPFGPSQSQPPLVGFGKLRSVLIVCVRKLHLLIKCHNKRIAQNACDIKSNQTKIAALEALVATLQTQVAANTACIATNKEDIATNTQTLCTHEAWLRFLARTTCFIDDFPTNPPLDWSAGTWNGNWPQALTW